jgi:hypothetical protein
MPPPGPHLHKGSRRTDEHYFLDPLGQTKGGIEGKETSVGIANQMSSLNLKAAEQVNNPLDKLLVATDRACGDAFIHLTNDVNRISTILLAQRFDIPIPYSSTATARV